MTDHAPTSAVLIATLGSEPQVVTLTLDLLLARDHALAEVVVVHTAATHEPIAAALRALAQEWGLYPAYASLSFRRIEIVADGQPVADVDTEAGAAAAFRALYGAVVQSKRQGYRVHLSISGGRKTMSAYGMAVAQLLFERGDCLWHLLSAGALLNERRLHAGPADDVRLTPIPVLRWSAFSPTLPEVLQEDDPFEALRRQEEIQARTGRRQQAVFVEQVLTAAERQAVERVVREGWSNEQIAAHLHKSERTIAHQLSAAYGKASEYFGLEQVGRHTLIALLGEYYRRQ